MKTVYIIRDVWSRINGIYSSHDRAEKERLQLIDRYGGNSADYYIIEYPFDVSPLD